MENFMLKYTIYEQQINRLQNMQIMDSIAGIWHL